MFLYNKYLASINTVVQMKTEETAETKTKGPFFRYFSLLKKTPQGKQVQKTNLWAAFPKFCTDKARSCHHLVFNAAAGKKDWSKRVSVRFPIVMAFKSVFPQRPSASCFCRARYERVIIFPCSCLEKSAHPEEHAIGCSQWVMDSRSRVAFQFSPDGFR